jgi:hypothetical protein
MIGAIPPLPQDAFMAWCSVKKKRTGATLPLPLPYPSMNIIRGPNKKGKVGGNVPLTGEMRNAYEILVGNLKGNEPFVIRMRLWEDTIKMDV